MAILPDTDIELGKWYSATQAPPDLTAESLENNYSMILNTDDSGPRTGFYNHQDKTFYWQNERMADQSRSQKANDNQEIEEAKSVNAWLIIPNAPDFSGVQNDMVKSYADSLLVEEDDEDSIDDGFVSKGERDRPAHPVNPSLH
ncbi:hypothetical protein M0L20_01075 [Spirosoma sp. RP8]|uniref:Uncharacterized protein n=1 Tax=Spirosoma liriopis TaxID=2937440 RepID=A0ABT0HEK4_9BACT|nr:hypothetical protein [Spirosoma liriopis]MCK8490420.1 hypothetical protein [Spirosoma liriopis]